LRCAWRIEKDSFVRWLWAIYRPNLAFGPQVEPGSARCADLRRN
jgi:hypothetical protein